DAVTLLPTPANEPVRAYAPGSPARAPLEKRLAELAGERVELTATIGGERRPGRGEEFDVVMPHAHAHVLGSGRAATAEDASEAIEAALEVSAEWRGLSFDDRAAIFLRAADLLSGPWRDTL